jgi:hypothetical protein
MRSSVSLARSVLLIAALSACALPDRERGLGSQDWTMPAELHGARLGFEFSDPSAFEWREGARGAELVLARPAQYAPPVRAPQAIALLTETAFDEFVLEVELAQTGREYAHRDLCLFFGYRGPAQFGYVHLASAADENAHGVFLVDGAPRRQVTTSRSAGVAWGESGTWHRVRLERRAGRVRVWFDGSSEPVLEADAAPFAPGFLGFGSFDDVGAMRALTISGAVAPGPAGAPFSR